MHFRASPLSFANTTAVGAQIAGHLKLNIMEQLNRIELKGTVGTIRVQTVGNKKVARIFLATNYAYKGKDGEPVIETTWHNISAWESKTMPDLNKIQKGDKLYVTGRLRTQHYTGNDGVERTSLDVSAYKMQLLTGDEQFTYEC